jgi:MinD-like ATPase involved in chromosome partitioning or flagellar assembly
MAPVEPTVALVFSPESWVEDLHRHLTDHGGARVRQLVVEPWVALDEDYDALVVSHRWPALTRAFVDAVHVRARAVLGVYDPDEPAGREHLGRLGVDAVIEASAVPAEFVSTLRRLTGPRVVPDTAAPPSGLVPGGDASTESGRTTVVSGPTGSGGTEVALAVAHAVAGRGETVALVDADEQSPSIAPRLALPVEPNLLTAVDVVVHALGQLGDAVVPAAGAERLEVLAGFPSVVASSQVRAGEVVDVVRALGRRRSHVVVNTAMVRDRGPRPTGVVGEDADAIARAVTAVADAVVGVGLGNPVGVARLLSWAAATRAVAPAVHVHLVVNRAPEDRFRRGEITEEITRTFSATSVTFVPADERVDAAAWSARFVASGPFTRAVGGMARLAVPVRSSARSRRSRGASRRARGRVAR